MATEQNKYSYRRALRDDILSNEDEKVVEQKLVKMSKEDINAILCSDNFKKYAPLEINEECDYYLGRMISIINA